MSLTKIEQALKSLDEREKTLDAFFDPSVPFPAYSKGKTPRHRYADALKGDTAVIRGVLDAEKAHVDKDSTQSSSDPYLLGHGSSSSNLNLLGNSTSQPLAHHSLNSSSSSALLRPPSPSKPYVLLFCTFD